MRSVGWNKVDPRDPAQRLADGGTSGVAGARQCPARLPGAHSARVPAAAALRQRLGVMICATLSLVLARLGHVDESQVHLDRFAELPDHEKPEYVFFVPPDAG